MTLLELCLVALLVLAVWIAVLRILTANAQISAQLADTKKMLDATDQSLYKGEVDTPDIIPPSEDRRRKG